MRQLRFDRRRHRDSRGITRERDDYFGRPIAVLGHPASGSSIEDRLARQASL